MTEMLAQPAGPGLLIVAALLVAAFALILLLALRRRRGRKSLSQRQAIAEAAVPTALDATALTAALSEAEAAGQQRRLPGLYLSLARCRLDEGKTAAAEELLRKCILAAAEPGPNETHARARLALGDMAQTAGDLATACEHWQIARGIFYQLKWTSDHDAVEARMLRNGCPTDWVLTDF